MISTITEESIIDTIEKAALQATFVILDLEGTASMMAGYAMSRADLVIIPAQGSHLDTTEAFHIVSEAQGWVYGYTLQRAIEALQRELKGQS